MRTKHEEKRLAILKAALEVVTARGYSETKVEDIARKAGVAKGTVYLYFEDKPAIYVGLVDWLLEQAVALIREIAVRPLSPYEKLTEVFKKASVMFPSRPAGMSVVSLQGADQTTEVMHRVKRFVMPHMHRMVDEIAAIITEGIDIGEFRPVDPRLAALLYLNSFPARMFAMTHGFVEHDPGPMVQELLFCGILADGRGRPKHVAK